MGKNKLLEIEYKAEYHNEFLDGKEVTVMNIIQPKILKGGLFSEPGPKHDNVLFSKYLRPKERTI